MATAMTVLGNRQDAEDICQETFVQAYRHIASFDSGRDLRAWLYTILYRRCLNVIKKKKRLAGVLDRLRADPGAWAGSLDRGPSGSMEIRADEGRWEPPAHRLHGRGRVQALGAVGGLSPSSSVFLKRFFVFNEL